MKKPVLVIGHLNPDTDSICSAIAYAYLKEKLGVNAIPARAGKINPETQFVLDYFKVPAPVLVNDLYPRLGDIKVRETPSVLPETTLHEVGKIFAEQNLRAVPVVEETGKLAGMIAVKDLAMRYYNEMSIHDLHEAGVYYKSILTALDGKLFCGDLEKKFCGKIKIGASDVDTISASLGKQDLVIIGDRVEAQLAALRVGAAGLILTRDTKVEAEVLELAENMGALIISTPHDTYKTARLINQSVPVQFLMTKDVVSFTNADLLAVVQAKMSATDYICYPVIEKGKYIGTVDQQSIMGHPRREVILVDHNERSQAVDGVDEAKILEIIDHHRLGGLTTSAPIYIRQEPVGSTATIVANLIFHRGVELEPKIAGVLMSAIVSDTLLFRSPTATPLDKETALKLAAIAGIEDVEDYAMKLLRHGDVISTMSPADLVRNDIKEFDFGEQKVGVAQINIMDREYAKTKYPELQSALQALKKEDGYDFALLLVTDILGQASDLLVAGEPQSILIPAFGEKTEEGFYYLPGCLSRKKQVIPPLTEVFR